MIIALIIIAHLAFGIAGSWLMLTNLYKEFGKIEHDDIATAFWFSLTGLIGLIVGLFITFEDKLRSIHPIKKLFTNIAENITNYFKRKDR